MTQGRFYTKKKRFIVWIPNQIAIDNSFIIVTIAALSVLIIVMAFLYIKQCK